jgi:hypothetical protein
LFRNFAAYRTTNPITICDLQAQEGKATALAKAP